MVDEKQMVSRDFMETQIAIARVETMLSTQRDDFIEHAEKDDKSFNELYNMSRTVQEGISAIPQRMSECREELKSEMADDMAEHFVSKTTFEVFTTKIVYSITGGIAMAGAIQWALSAFIKFNGG